MARENTKDWSVYERRYAISFSRLFCYWRYYKRLKAVVNFLTKFQHRYFVDVDVICMSMENRMTTALRVLLVLNLIKLNSFYLEYKFNDSLIE